MSLFTSPWVRRNRKWLATVVVLACTTAFFVVLLVLARSVAQQRNRAGKPLTSSTTGASKLAMHKGSVRDDEGDAFDTFLSQDRGALLSETKRLQQRLDESEARVAQLQHELQDRPTFVAQPTNDAPAPLMHRPKSVDTMVPEATVERRGDVPHAERSPPRPPLSSNEAHSPLWLVVGIPTVPRRGEDPNHLPSTLLYRTARSYLEQLAQLDGLRRSVRVLIINQRRDAHPVFYAVKREWAQLQDHAFFGAAARCFEFVDRAPDDTSEAMYGEEQAERASREAAAAGYDDGIVHQAHEMPTTAVRRQSLDAVRMLDHAIRHPSTYFLFSEDDFLLCANGLLALQYVTGKASWYLEHGTSAAPPSAIRCGFGLNGILLRNAKPYEDVARFREYLYRHFARRPPDHLVVEFFAKETRAAQTYFGPSRRPAAFRHNLFLHTGGAKSTLRDEEAWSTPSCFTELIVPQLFEVEAWNPRDCGGDDFWPCDSPAADHHVVLRWNISKNTEVSKRWSTES